ncbi:DUF4192 domain-containing protein [Nocardia sp. NPDC051756]|uniref:DUF4192 domain-containing protein n=1 Tax=Nocardia sp. NPDC051756 TaxID=3154751 RepID=UPI00342090BD
MSSSHAYIEDPGDLIAAIPAMLGFVPERSLLIVVLADSECHPPSDSAQVFAIMRFDLEMPPGHCGEPAEIIAAAVDRVCASADSTEVLAVVVDDNATATDSGPHPALITDLVERLADDRIGLEGAWAVTAIEPGSRWWSLLDPSSQGVVPDPQSSDVTAAMNEEGKPVYASRSELVALIQPDFQAVERVERLLPTAHAEVRRRAAVLRRDDNPDGGLRWGIERVLGLIAAHDAGALPTDAESAQFAALVVDDRVRDALMATALSNYAQAAQSLWTYLTRSLPLPERAQAAVLLAYSAYVRRDGVLAGIAVQTALDAVPYHRFAILLEGALEIGLDPHSMRRLGRSGAEIVRGVGIEIDLPEDRS